MTKKVKEKMYLSRKDREDIREMYVVNKDIDMISKKYNIPEKNIKYLLGIYGIIELPKPYIEEKEERETRIKELLAIKGKGYKDICYLNFLRGELSKGLYESVFI